ncbi:hypothetical protein [uncultured Methanobrevibacter sp.]|uniref:hypothetical protein n=1 Tax=uncultured Methanobrevibacter sp. TaxID=253161 RepID=UPI002637E265|nr:hypothetical protein [uncultured Methanobrevibacter sp.]
MKSNINHYYRKNDSKRILQGDILKDFKIHTYDDKVKMITIPYGVVLSQDCDLNQDYNSQKEYERLNLEKNDKNNPNLNSKLLPSILICPAYDAEQLRKGEHLQHIDIPMNEISKTRKTPWKNILQNQTPRYHYLKESEEFGIPDLVLDFKRYYSVSRDYLYSIYTKHYFISINELYREDLSDRFFNYQSRIGLPK